MKLYFGTVNRAAPLQQGGEIVKLDWKTKKIIAKKDIVPGEPDLSKDPNPRGRSRGCRGIEILADKIVAANYHSLDVFDHDLNRIDCISNHMMVGLHEIKYVGNNKMWVSSTAIDAAFLVDLKSGQIHDEYWPRENAYFQNYFDLHPLEIDKSADNRDKYLNIQPKLDKGHLHLNAVTEYNGEVYALFNRFGAVANLSAEKVIFEHKKIRGAHNLVFIDEEIVAINDTVNGETVFFNFRNGKFIKGNNLKKQKEVVRHTLRSSINYRTGQILRKLKLKSSPVVARPLFVRGLMKKDNLLFVGTSPAMILCFDLNTDELIDYFVYSKNTRVAIHGLNVIDED